MDTAWTLTRKMIVTLVSCRHAQESLRFNYLDFESVGTCKRPHWTRGDILETLVKVKLEKDRASIWF